MRTCLLLIALLGSLILPCAQAEPSTLTISTNNTPLDRKALEGLSREALRRIGKDLQLLNLPSERSLHAANIGDVDGEGLRVAGLESQYPNLLRVPESFIAISFVAFARDASIRLDQGWDSLKPYSVAFITGWKLYESNAMTARTVNKVDKPEQLFRMLDGGRVDLALYTREDGLALIRSLGLSAIGAVSPPLKEAEMYLYLNQRHQALVQPLAKALRAMKMDGTYNRILAAQRAD